MQTAPTEPAVKRHLPLGPPGHEHIPRLALSSDAENVEAYPLTPISSHVLRTARSVAEALFANDLGPPDPKRIDWLIADFENFLGRGGAQARGVMRLCLFALEWLAPLFVGRPFFALGWLSAEQRLRALSRIEHSPLSPVALAPKAILCILWFEHPDTQREMGTEATCLRAPGAA